MFGFLFYRDNDVMDDMLVKFSTPSEGVAKAAAEAYALTGDVEAGLTLFPEPCEASDLENAEELDVQDTLEEGISDAEDLIDGLQAQKARFEQALEAIKAQGEN